MNKPEVPDKFDVENYCLTWDEREYKINQLIDCIEYLNEQVEELKKG